MKDAKTLLLEFLAIVNHQACRGSTAMADRPEVVRLTGGKRAEVAFDPVGGPTFGHLAELTIRGFGLPSIVADDAKLAALKQFIGDGLAAAALRPAIAKVFPFEEIVSHTATLKLANRLEK